MRWYYKLTHEYALNDHKQKKYIGIYSTKQNAERAAEKLRDAEGFCDYPDSFVIKRVFRIIKPKLLDKTFWEDGFFTVCL